MADSAQIPADSRDTGNQPEVARSQSAADGTVGPTILVDGADTCVIFPDGSTILLKGIVRVEGSFLL